LLFNTTSISAIKNIQRFNSEIKTLFRISTISSKSFSTKMEKSNNNTVATLIEDYNALKKQVGENPAHKTLLNEVNKAIVFNMITKFALEKQIHR